MLEGVPAYVLEDQYMTTRMYVGSGAGGYDNVLDSEKAEILARLKRIKAEHEKAEAERQAQAPR
jgi:hypothetical protein